MPARPKSKRQLRFTHAAARRGEEWAEETIEEWHGKKFKNLPEKAKKKKGGGGSRTVRA